MTIKELKTELKALKTELEKEQARNRKIYFAYCDLEGKYGKEVVEDLGMCMRGSYYKYAEGMKEKEDAERKQFLIDNNYLPQAEIYHKYADKINELEEQICKLQHGMGREEWRLVTKIKNLEKQKAEIEDKINKTEAKLNELRKE